MQFCSVKKRFSCAMGVAAIAAMCAFSSAARADVAITSLTGGNTIVAPGTDYSLGWKFTANSNMAVTAFGWWDNNHDGLVQSHDVGIWTDGGGTLLGSGTVAGGLGGTLVGDFRYTDLGGPILLTAGQSYVIGGVNGTEDYLYGTVATTSGSLTYNEDRWDPASILTYPSQTAPGSENAYFGPTFAFAAVPEPGTYAMGAGMLLSALLAFRKKRLS